MSDLKDKTVLVIDDGIFIEFAIRLSRDFKKVYYWSNWKSEYPISKDDMVGSGVPGITRVSEVYDYIDKVDMIAFTSIYHGDWQSYLVKKGYRVFGSGKGDELERDRVSAIEHFKELGLPQPKYKEIEGIDNLIEYLEDKEDKWIKVSEYRGGNETWHYLSKDLSRRKLSEIKHSLGDEGKIFKFLVFDPINGDDIVECGSDVPITVDGQYPKYILNGYEKKDCCYLGRVRKYSDLCPVITDFNDKIAPTLKSYRYRNAMSTEIRAESDKKGTMIDFTARQPSPPGEIYLELISNFSQMIWDASGGILTEPVYAAKYGIEVMINSEAAENAWLTVKFPKSIRQWVKFRNLAVIEGEYTIIPRHKDFNNIGAIIAIGNSIDEVVELAKERCKQIEGEDIDCKLDDIKPLMDIVKRGEAIGLKF